MTKHILIALLAFALALTAGCAARGQYEAAIKYEVCKPKYGGLNTAAKIPRLEACNLRCDSAWAQCTSAGDAAKCREAEACRPFAMRHL